MTSFPVSANGLLDGWVSNRRHSPRLLVEDSSGWKERANGPSVIYITHPIAYTTQTFFLILSSKKGGGGGFFRVRAKVKRREQMDPLPFNWGPLKEEHAGSFKVGLQINLKILRHFHLWVFLLIIPIWISAKFNDDKLGEHCGQLESPWIQVISSKCRHRPQSWTIEHHQSSISITNQSVNQSIDHNHEQLNIINHQHQCNRHRISSHILFFSEICSTWFTL